MLPGGRRRPGAPPACPRTAPSGPRAAAAGPACSRASARDNASSWLASCEVRRVAPRSLLTCSAGNCSVPPGWWLLAACAQASTWACRPASGVRSWCAASATKRRWLSACAFTSPNSRLSESHQRPHLLGRGCSRRSRSGRAASAAPPPPSASSSGLQRPLAPPSRTAKAAAPISTRLGSSTLNRIERAHCWRGSEPSASATTTSPTHGLLALPHDAPGDAAVLLAVELRLRRRGRRAPRARARRQQLAVGVEDGEAGGALASLRNSSSAGASSSTGGSPGRCPGRSPSRPAAAPAPAGAGPAASATLSAER